MKLKYILLTPILFAFISCSSLKNTENNSPVSSVENPFDNENSEAGTELTNDKIWYSGEFYGKSVRGVRSMNDGEHFTAMDNGEMGPEINKYSYKTYEKVSTILTFMDLKDEDGKPIPIDAYEFSADEQKVLIATEQESIYRRSSKSYYYIYDLKTKKTIPLSDKELGKQRLADFSPSGNLVAFVRENNMFFVNTETGKEIQITDAIADLMNEQAIYGYIFEGKRFDCGSKLGYLKATIEYALEHKELSKEFKNYIKIYF